MPSDNHVKAALSLIEDKSKVLGLTIGTHENVQPGTYLPRKSTDQQSEYELTKTTAAQEPPKLSFTGANPTSTYLVVSLDIDAPFTSFRILSPILHWIQSDIRVTSEGALEFDAPFVANYIGPSPPPLSAPHRYLFFLYEQPADFDLTAHAPAGGKKLGNSNRIRYDLDAWAEQIKLGPLVAFNYFTCN
ncbi:Protease inhibitor (Tfs1) [Penicillium samsonianum]|uniref:Protease inhibitor (Tfs1) n=1 Tax=Penicillium samsonianum TaxID=1882272 RepID=UPI00254816DC|nr:Protease inhibitor (Tfs1) [Penicillium samsonianum]KAJ6132145.1 Protease inhibitor (Tfs1) [Penicillium samsonianum]